VGFIQKLPTNLIAAFRATLEEISEADVLLHVTDISNDAWRKQEASVLTELAKMVRFPPSADRSCAYLNALCPMSYVLCPMSYVLCPMSYVLRPTSYVLCPNRGVIFT
jgi:hypothetical protein